jgi:hypothetical protein
VAAAARVILRAMHGVRALTLPEPAKRESVVATTVADVVIETVDGSDVRRVDGIP